MTTTATTSGGGEDEAVSRHQFDCILNLLQRASPLAMSGPGLRQLPGRFRAIIFPGRTAARRPIRAISRPADQVGAATATSPGAIPVHCPLQSTAPSRARLRLDFARLEHAD